MRPHMRFVWAATPLALAVTGLLVLAACGGADPTPTTPPPTATPTATAAPAPPTATPTAGGPGPVATATPTRPPAPVATATAAVQVRPGFAYGGQFGRTKDEWWKHPEVVKLYEAAKREGVVVLRQQSQESADLRCAIFARRFPGVRCEGSGTTTQNEVPELLTDRAAGRKIVDVIESAISQMILAERANLFADVDWTLYGVDKTRILDAKGHFPTYTQSMFTHWYRSDLVKKEDLPKTFEDFANPKWKNKLVASNFLYYQNMGYWVTRKGIDYVVALGQKLEKENNMVVVPNPVDLLNSGERIIYYQSFAFPIRQRDFEKLPLDYYVTDNLGLNQFTTGAVIDAPHPNAAKLFVVWFMSEEGSEVNYRFLGNPLKCPCGQGWPEFGHDASGEVIKNRTTIGKDLIPQTPTTIGAMADGAAEFRKRMLGQ